MSKRLMDTEHRNSPTILLIDDTPENLSLLITCLEEADLRVAVAQSGEEALERVAYVFPDLILLDVVMSGMDGFEACRRLKANPDLHDIPVIFMTVMSEITDKVEGFEAGGIDYIIKPFQPEEVLARVKIHLTIRQLQQQLQARNAILQEKNAQLQREIAIRKQAEDALHMSQSHEIELEHERDRLAQENVSLRSGMRERYKFGDIIGRSGAMQDVYEAIAKAAASDANVLLCGESGTGKEIVAQTIHRLSERRNHMFVPVNCGAVPETLFEREFFGHRKGAFTNAVMDSPGYFDQAHQGTLFLDEVAELPPTLQIKLLRALEYKEYTPIGATRSKQVDVRIISATNKNLKTHLSEGLIREDFFYRIRILVITLPPLRKRREDIPLLVEYFLSQYGYDQSVAPIPGKIMDALRSYHWPGNVRELQNEIQRYLAEQRLEFIGNAPGIQKDEPNLEIMPAGQGFREAVEAYEKRLLLEALTQNAWHQGKTAKMLQLPPRTLYEKIKKYQLKVK
jgi:formate hydrogenlyase transcriptional activator